MKVEALGFSSSNSSGRGNCSGEVAGNGSGCSEGSQSRCRGSGPGLRRRRTGMVFCLRAMPGIARTPSGRLLVAQLLLSLLMVVPGGGGGAGGGGGGGGGMETVVMVTRAGSGMERGEVSSGPGQGRIGLEWDGWGSRPRKPSSRHGDFFGSSS